MSQVPTVLGAKPNGRSHLRLRASVVSTAALKQHVLHNIDGRGSRALEPLETLQLDLLGTPNTLASAFRLGSIGRRETCIL